RFVELQRRAGRQPGAELLAQLGTQLRSDALVERPLGRGELGSGGGENRVGGAEQARRLSGSTLKGKHAGETLEAVGDGTLVAAPEGESKGVAEGRAGLGGRILIESQ